MASLFAVHAKRMRTLERLYSRKTGEIFPAVASVKRYNKPDITVDGGRASFPISKDEPTPFRCSGPHSPS